MAKKQLSIMIIMLLLLGILPLAFNIRSIKADAATIYVDHDNTSGPWDGTSEHPYRNITSGLAHASAGDTIFVRMGNYNENVIVNKFVRLIGEKPQDTKIIGQSSTSDTVKITAGGCILENFTITNGGKPSRAGLRINSNDNLVRNNIISNNNDDGIWIQNSVNNTVTNNTVSCALKNSGSNIILESCSDSLILNNIIRVSTGGWGMYVRHSSDNVISNNVISGIEQNEGISLGSNSCNNTVTRNSITDCLYGISLEWCSGNLIADNTISDSFRKRIYDEYEGGSGIILWTSTGNSIVNNRLVKNILDGVSLDSASSSNFIYHNNFVNNTDSVSSSGAVNVWDDGYPSGGNYWSDYAGVDTNHDGIGDSPYVIDATNQDEYPLMAPLTHDVEVDDLSPVRTIAGSGYPLSINLTMANHDFEETVHITVYANDTAIDTRDATLAIRSLTVFTFTWNTFDFPKGNYTISAFVNPVWGETDTVDNTYTYEGTVFLSIPGDVNGDKTVNMTDATLLSTYFGRLDIFPNGDINNDGAINVLDAVILINYYGSSW